MPYPLGPPAITSMAIFKKVAAALGGAVGGLITLDVIDSMMGSPIKNLLGIDSAQGLDEHDIKKLKKKAKKQEKERKRQVYADGFIRYLAALEKNIPTYVSRNRAYLAGVYKRGVDRYMEKTKELSQIAHAAKAPLVHVAKPKPPKYVPMNMKVSPEVRQWQKGNPSSISGPGRDYVPPPKGDTGGGWR